MDYLDPEKMKQHRLLLFIGYVLIGVAIVVATLILLYQANGFGIARNGTVIQNGLIFFSSQPKGAQIYLNGQLNSNTTNARLVLPANIYNVELRKTGYKTWQRTLSLDGGSVEHFDYPMLFPNKLTTTTVDTIAGTPDVASQSPDRRWVIVSHSEAINELSVYDLKNPSKAPFAVSLPDGLLTNGIGAEHWQIAEWADDNQHVLLQHIYDDKMEYVLVDRTSGGQSVNLSTTLGITPTKLTLNNRKYDLYYLYNAADQTLKTASLKNTDPVTLLDHVLSYQSYSDDSVLYATDIGAPSGKVSVKLKIANQIYSIRSVSAGANYVLNLTSYSGSLYVACGSSADNKVYIYHDPIGQIKAQTSHLPVPLQVLHVMQPNFLSFSSSAQFILVENGSQIAIYDIENKHAYNYTLTAPIDPPQMHVTWMDGDRIEYVSNNKLIIVDYDDTNARTLVAARASSLPAFSADFTYLYTFVHASSPEDRTALTQTSLLVGR